MRVPVSSQLLHFFTTFHSKASASTDKWKMYSPFAEVLNHALKDLLNIQVDGLPEFKAHIVIGHYFCSYFLSIFDPTSLHIPYPTFPPYVYPCYVYSLMLFTLTNRRQRLQFDWYDQTPNNSSTGLPTF